jgi:hypothetical protein
MTDFEREDLELASVMGGKFVDLTQEPAEKRTAKPVAAPVQEKKYTPVKDIPEKEKPAKALWMPPKPAPNFTDKLVAMAKESCLFGALSLILFYWQQTGRLDYTTSWYALLVCVGMVFFTIGKHCRGGVQ